MRNLALLPVARGRVRVVRRSPLTFWTWACGAPLFIASIACNDTPGPPVAPGNVVTDDSMQDAVAQYTQDTGVYAPQGIGDAGDGSSYADAPYGSTGYIDAQSPLTACSSCTCDERVAFCLENGTSATVSGEAGVNNDCPLAKQAKLAVGCNVLPAACLTTPTCECVLNAVQPPLGCYPECTTTAGYIDVYCNVP